MGFWDFGLWDFGLGLDNILSTITIYLKSIDTTKKTLGAKIINIKPVRRLFNAICVSFPVP